MQTIEVTVPICIYGVSLKAIKLEKCLRNAGFNDIFFLDRNPSNVPFNVEVMKPEEYDRKAFETTVVIIMVMNVYSHGNIAKQLHEMGFRYVLYKSNIYHKDVNGDIFDVFNDCLYFDNGHEKIQKILGRLIEPVDHATENELSPVILQTDEEIVSYVPAEILYSMSQKDYEDIHPNKVWMKIPYDRCSLYYLICGELFQSFENGVDLDYWDVYNKLNQDRMFFQKENFDKEYKRHLRQRYEVYVYMSEMFNRNYSFFSQNPVMVCWNSDLKIFNIIDGNNRTAFLLAKGVYFIPCRMNIKDYQSWMNNETVKKFLVTCKNWKEKMRYPVSNPCFCMYDTGNGLYARKYLHVILRKLFKIDFEISGCRMLDAMSDNGFFAYCFAKSGAESCWIKEESAECDYYRGVWSMVYAENVEELSGVEVRNSEYDLALVSADKIINLEMDEIKANIMIIEFREDKELSNIISMWKSGNYEIISGLMKDGEVRKLALFREG